MGGDLCLTLKTMFWCSFHPVSQLWVGSREGGGGWIMNFIFSLKIGSLDFDAKKPFEGSQLEISMW